MAKKWIFAALCMAQMAFAEPVNLTGKIGAVQNGLLINIQGASVSLINSKLSATSGADGSFQIVGNTESSVVSSSSVVVDPSSSSNTPVLLQQNSVIFLKEAALVSVVAISLTGQKTSLLQQKFAAGRVDLNLEGLSRSLPEGHYVIQIRYGSQKRQFEYVQQSGTRSLRGFNQAAALAVTATGDTLLVSKTGYLDLKVELTNLVQDLDYVVISDGTSSSSVSSSSSVWSSYSYTNTTCLQWLTPYVFDMAFNNSRRHVQHSYQNFIDAMAKVPEFMCKKTMTETQQKQELAAFFAQLRQETYGLVYIEEICGTKGSCLNTYNTDWSGIYAPVAGKSYHGRGAMQLSWPGNYGQASEYLYKTKTTLLNTPELVMQDGKVSFATAMWFWAVRTEAGGPCTNAYWNTGFGGTTKIINGALECGASYGTAAKNRETYYQAFLTQFGVSDSRAASAGCQ